MASAPMPFASIKETTNYARPCRLVDVGSQALRASRGRLTAEDKITGDDLSVSIFLVITCKTSPSHLPHSCLVHKKKRN